jgi:hypothetical protein
LTKTVIRFIRVLFIEEDCELMRIVIHNLRAGFATNSSSSHSVVLIPDDLIGKVDNDGSYTDPYFGESDFRLVTNEYKLRYLAAQISGGIRSSDDRAKFVQMFAPHVPEIDELLDNDEFGVDGNSSITLPSDPMHPAYLQAMMKVFLSDRVVVYGGHDGGSNTYAVPGAEDEPVYDQLKSLYSATVRTEGPYMTVFDRHSGNKMRLSTDEAPPYVKSKVPELVDLKITDYCAQGCNFCYQSSTTKGKHADTETIFKIIDTLADLGVFEIALGGGEPTDHPDFVRIIERISKRQMTPNFTTLSSRWLENKFLIDAVRQCVGAIGVSCASAKALDLVDQIGDRVNKPWGRTKIMAQHVVGAQPLWVTAEFMTAAFERGIPVLLLGYKEVGFGKKFARHDLGQDVPFFLRMAVKGTANASLSVDTALLDQYPSIPDVLAAPLALTTSPEGKFSCYVDAVRKKMAASSYVEPRTMEPLRLNPEEFKQAYAAY